MVWKEVNEVYVWSTKVRPTTVPWVCFTAESANSTVTLYKNGSPTSVTIETSTDGSTWSTYTFWTSITLANVGDKVIFRNASATATWFSTSQSNFYWFSMSGSVACSWDVTYLLCKEGTNTLSNYCFYGLFMQCRVLTTTPTLPATELANYCYFSMFNGCRWITTPPALPATTLKTGCYNWMFTQCIGLTTVPQIPATTLANYCCQYMFNWCTNLTAINSLPVTTMSSYCYKSMYEGCSKIKLSTSQTGDYQTAYRIPTSWTGTTASSWAQYMFSNTWGTFTGTPSINTTYYTSNTVV